jgi:hypothetical protein
MVSDSPQQGLVVLVIENDPAIGKALLQGLREAGHTCRWGALRGSAR